MTQIATKTTNRVSSLTPVHARCADSQLSKALSELTAKGPRLTEDEKKRMERLVLNLGALRTEIR